eukprot:Partr_v1_DN28849_c2_g1_i2_m34183 putative Peptidyl-prolyl cis-trans isomerase
MATSYINEPSTQGKIVIKSSLGDLEVELWPKQAPKATRNFLQLSMDGYYDACQFHRVIPNFIAQTGDPSGTGLGGESVYGEPFEVEKNSRLRFGHRGLLAMASDDVEGTCKSQFFFSLDQTPELNGHHTIFGKIVGDTIFNLLKMNDIEVDEATDRPVYPPTIYSIAILHNPFEEMVPRPNFKPVHRKPESVAEQRKREVKERKGVNNKSLLSFAGGDGDDLEEMDAPIVKLKAKSAHEALKNDSRLSRTAVTVVQDASAPVPTTRITPAPYKSEESPSIISAAKDKPVSVESEIARVKREIQQLEKATKASAVSKISSSLSATTKKRSLLEQERDAFLSESQKRKRVLVGKRQRAAISEDETMARILGFRQKIREKRVDVTAGPEMADELCKLHNVPECESCNRVEMKEDDAVDGDDWMGQKLHFGKDLHGKNVLDPNARRMDNVEDLVVIDPRARKAQFGNNASHKNSGK